MQQVAEDYREPDWWLDEENNVQLDHEAEEIERAEAQREEDRARTYPPIGSQWLLLNGVTMTVRDHKIDCGMVMLHNSWSETKGLFGLDWFWKHVVRQVEVAA